MVISHTRGAMSIRAQHELVVARLLDKDCLALRQKRGAPRSFHLVQPDMGVSENRGVPYFGVLIRRILLFRAILGSSSFGTPPPPIHILWLQVLRQRTGLCTQNIASGFRVLVVWSYKDLGNLYS